MKTRQRSTWELAQLVLAACGLATCLTVGTAQAELGDELFKLTASDATPGDHLGRGVAVSGNIAIVGASFDDENGSSSGSAYLFDATTGQEIWKLTASDAVASTSFGSSVAIGGNTAIVGGNTSKAYLFDITTGHELGTLIPSDAMGSSVSVCIDGSIAILGVGFGELSPNGIRTGAAYVFDLTTRQEILKLTSSDPTDLDRFGNAVALSGNFAVVTARIHDGAADNAGAAYVFDLKTGNQLWKLIPSDAHAYAAFGWSVSVSGNIAIVGAPDGPNVGSGRTGAAYLFDITTGQELRKLIPGDDQPDAEFGFSVGISGSTAIVGARYADNSSGSAYLFDVSTGEQLRKLVATGIRRDQWFGDAVAIEGNIAIVGALQDDNPTLGDGTGSAYVFDVSRSQTLTGDFNGSGTVDAADYVVWRKGLGTTYMQADYDTWRANFGQTMASGAGITSGAVITNLPSAPGSAGGSSPTVPEPSALVLTALAVLPLHSYLRRRVAGRPSSVRHASRMTPLRPPSAALRREPVL